MPFRSTINVRPPLWRRPGVITTRSIPLHKVEFPIRQPTKIFFVIYKSVQSQEFKILSIPVFLSAPSFPIYLFSPNPYTVLFLRKHICLRIERFLYRM